MIGYLGPKGTFSHLAALEYFGEDSPLVPYGSIHSLIVATENQEITKAILPIENSIEGSVNMTLDTLMFDVDLCISGEFILKIEQNLMVRPGTPINSIQKIYSHPQPIAQCSKLIENTFKNISIEYLESTASAAKKVMESSEPYAVLGPAGLSSIYGLEILKDNCQDDPNNHTRFVIVEKNAPFLKDADKTSIAFTLDDRPGSLYNALEIFATNGVNMIKIESRPVKKELGKYVFFIDIEADANSKLIKNVLEKVRQHTDLFKFLGTYKKAQM